MQVQSCGVIQLAQGRDGEHDGGGGGEGITSEDSQYFSLLHIVHRSELSMLFIMVRASWERQRV